jgi:signal transduction histidine kinase
VAFHGIKTNIALKLAILLAVAMLLVNIIMLVSVQRDYVQSAISKGYLLTDEIGKHLVKKPESGNLALENGYGKYLGLILKIAGFSCAILQDKDSNIIYPESASCPSLDELKNTTKESIESSRKITRLTGDAWGVLWMQNRYLLISAPLLIDGNTAAGAGIVIELDSIYSVLRQSQKILLVYSVINLLLLTVAGLYLISNIALKPVQKMALRAEEFRDDGDLFFLYGKQNNEFDRLSKALNRLLKRVSDDKDKLLSSISSLEKANIDLKQAQKEVVMAEKLASVGRLSSGIAHEIGNPVGIVQGYLDLLRRNDISDEKKKEYIRRAGDEINRIDAIIRQLLDFSRPSEEKIGITGVHEIIRDTAEMVKHQPFMAGIETSLLLSAENDNVLCDPGQLRQVFLNLFINSADAVSSSGKGKGSLIIKSEETEKTGTSGINGRSVIRISFEDDGPGIPEENIGNIFDPFFTTKEPGKGTGLGLYVCFTLINGMGGMITAESSMNVGTAINISLPLHETGGG